MDLFNKKKVERLKYKNKELELKVKHLEEENELLQRIVDNNGYDVPKIHKLIFTNNYSQLVKIHFSSIINFMNAKNIEILSEDVNDTGFVISYRLPPDIDNVNFNFNSSISEYPCGSITYQTNFSYRDVANDETVTLNDEEEEVKEHV